MANSIEPFHSGRQDMAQLPPIEFTKLSIHCHFGNVGDKKDADRLIDFEINKPIAYNMKSAIEQVGEAWSCGFRLLAHTNSNTLNLPYYYLLRHYAHGIGIELLPGAEFNLQNWEDDDRYLHVVVVFDPESDLFTIDELVQGAIAENGKNYLTIGQLSHVLTSGRAIVCVHGVKQKKDNHSLSKNAEMAPELAGLNCFMPVAIEDNESYHRDTLEAELRKELADEACFKWLDLAASISCADRKPFSEISSPTVMWASKTFPDLFHAALMGGSRIKREADAVEKSNYIARIEIDKGKGLQGSVIGCSHGLNAIIGQSGSGKTLLLDIIKRALTGDALVNRSISKEADYSNLYDLSQVHLYDKSGNEIDTSLGYKVVEGENLYQLILEMHRKSKAELIKKLGIELEQSRFRLIINDFEKAVNDYADSLRALKGHADDIASALAQIESAEKFLAANDNVQSDHIDYVVDSQLQNDINKSRAGIEALDADLENARQHFEELLNIAERQRFDDDFIGTVRNLRDEFIHRLKRRRLQLGASMAKLEFKLACQKTIRKAALDFTNSMGAKGKQVSETRQIIVDSYAKMASILLEDAELRLDCKAPVLDSGKIVDSIRFENENAPAKLVVSDVKPVFERDDLREILPTCVGAKKTESKPGVNAFADAPYDFTHSESVHDFVKVFVDFGFEGEIDFAIEPERLLDYEIQLQFEGSYRPIESLSAGTLGKVYVEHFFDRTIAEGGSNTIILYDQPESNMEKEFVFGSLVRKFDELRNRYQIFIATHEPLLVVNADSNEIIRAINQKTIGERSASIGYENCSFVGAAGRVDVVRDVARLIDGHEDAVAKRSNVYRGLGNSAGRNKGTGIE